MKKWIKSACCGGERTCLRCERERALGNENFFVFCFFSNNVVVAIVVAASILASIAAI